MEPRPTARRLGYCWRDAMGALWLETLTGDRSPEALRECESMAAESGVIRQVGEVGETVTEVDGHVVAVEIREDPDAEFNHAW